MKRRSNSNNKRREIVTEEDAVYQSQSQSQEQRNHRPNFYDYINIKKKANKSKLAENNKSKKANNQDYLKIVDSKNYRKYLWTLSNKYDDLNCDFHDQQEEITNIKRWIQLGHNVCIYGFGSKIKLLESLHQDCFSDEYVFQIRGFIAPPKMKAKQIYTYFGDFLIRIGLVKDIKSHTIKDQLKQYRQIIDNKLDDIQSTRIVILLHSIDGPGLLDQDSQRQIAQLFSIPKIQIVASLDSIKIVMNWSPVTFEKFAFLFFCVNTGHPYIRQQINRPNNKEKNEKSESAFAFIWQSLSKNQKQILKYVAKNQLNNKQKKAQNNYTLSDILDICVQNMILSDDSQLRQNLVQLIDHNVIKQKFDDQKNRKVYVMKFDKELLQKIVNDKIGQNVMKAS